MSESVDARSHKLATARKFLQTVVLIDDHAYAPNGEAAGVATMGDLELPIAGDPDLELQEIDDALTPSDEPEETEELHTENIVKGFADEGIICSVLAPSQSDESVDENRLKGLAGRADVLLLDWLIRPRSIGLAGARDSNGTSIQLLVSILLQDRESDGGRTRLICIYTGETDLGAVSKKIVSGLGAAGFQAVELDGLMVEVGASKIVIVGKEKRHSVPGRREVPAAGLASLVVEEFASFVADGLISEVALRALSAVRDQSHKVLRRFSGDLDPALISHRSITGSAATDKFLTGMIGSELSSIVSASEVAAPLAEALVVERIEALLGEQSEFAYWKGETAMTPLNRERTVAVLTKGVGEDGFIKNLTPKLKFEAKLSRSTLLVDQESDDVRSVARSIDLRMSALSLLARDSRYDKSGTPHPELQLGSLLVSEERMRPAADPTGRDGGGLPSSSQLEGDASIDPLDGISGQDTAVDGRQVERPQIAKAYWLCLQPLCDSVRLDEPTRFPLLPLDVVPHTKTKYQFVVAEDEQYITLRARSLKLKELSIETFAPDDKLRVVLARWVNGAWRYESTDGSQYGWLGDLRLDKAHKLLHGVVTAAGRIGIDEYEHLRLAGE